jgi:tetratricopeptide (TPR) repeat protein
MPIPVSGFRFAWFLVGGAVLLCVAGAVALLPRRAAEPPPAEAPRDAAAIRRDAESLQDPEALLAVGEQLRRLGEPRASFELIARAYDRKFKDPRFAGAMIEALLTTNQIRDARALAEPLVTQAPKSGEVRAALALVLLEAGYYSRALELARKAAELEPNSPRVWRALARANGKEKRLPEAWAAYEKAVALAPDDGGLLADYGGDLVLYGRAKEGEATLRRAVGMLPRDPKALTLLGQCLGEQSPDPARQAEAIGYARKAVELAPSAPDPHYQLGRLLLQSGDTAGAITALETCLRLDGTLLEAWLPLGQAYQTVGRQEAAREALARYRRYTDLRRELAHLRLRLRQNPNSISALVRLGELAEANDQYAEALKRYRQALRLRADPALAKKVAWLARNKEPERHGSGEHAEHR